MPGMAQLKTERIEIRVTKDFLALVDAARGDVSRTRWIERALERALDVEGLPSEEAYRMVRGRKAPEVSSPKQAPSLRDTWAR
jgi:hypothetical protein